MLEYMRGDDEWYHKRCSLFIEKAKMGNFLVESKRNQALEKEQVEGHTFRHREYVNSPLQTSKLCKISAAVNLT